MNDARATEIRQAVQRLRSDQLRFLTELVRVPSDNPPGQCARHAGCVPLRHETSRH